MAGGPLPGLGLGVPRGLTDDRGTHFSRRQLVVAGLIVCLPVDTVGFAQAMSGYFTTQ